MRGDRLGPSLSAEVIMVAKSEIKNGLRSHRLSLNQAGSPSGPYPLIEYVTADPRSATISAMGPILKPRDIDVEIAKSNAQCAGQRLGRLNTTASATTRCPAPQAYRRPNPYQGFLQPKYGHALHLNFGLSWAFKV